MTEIDDTRPRSEILQAVRAEIAGLRPRLETMHELSSEDRAALAGDVSDAFDKLLYVIAILWDQVAAVTVAIDVANELTAFLDSFQPERPELPN